MARGDGMPERIGSVRDDRICVGVVVGAHGVKGWVRIKPFTEDPMGIAGYGPVSDEADARSFQVEIAGRAKGVVLARLSGVTDRDAADMLKGQRLYVPRTALPPTEAEEYYQADLVGLSVELADGTSVGRVAAVDDYGAGPVLTIERKDGAPLLLPFARRTVPQVDLAGGRLVVAPPAEVEAGERTA